MSLAAAVLLAAMALSACTGHAPASAAEAPTLAWQARGVTPHDDSASEVSIAVDPTDPLHVVAAANAGGGFAVYTSRDGGCTWWAERLTALSLFGVQGLAATSLSDPAVAFSPDGTLRLAGLALLPTSQVFLASRATADGNWHGTVVWRSDVAAAFNDKEWVGVSPSTGTIVVAWQREPAMDSLRGVEQSVAAAAGTSPDLDVGQVVVSRSTDGGQSWSLPTYAGSSLHSNGTQLAVTADGAWHLAWVDYEQPALMHSVSTDDGQTWGRPERIAPLHIVHGFSGFTRMHTLPGLATDGTRLTIAWHDAGADTADVLVSTWSNGTWSEAQRVPDDAAGADRVQIYPWVAYDDAGRLHVTYYSGVAGGNFTYRHMALESGAWTGPDDLGQPFPLVDGNGTAANIGDYTGVAWGQGLHAAWSQPHKTFGSGVFVASFHAPCEASA